ncbi:radical SAM protein, partial [Candidatus Bipolaricaulota bacterium]|nr:radical SAM protein [Candidatus Bipolaricaulota bacterium]
HKPSEYNVALHEPDGKTLVNLITEAVLEVDSDHLAEVESVLETPDAHAGSEVFKTLLDLGFLVDACFDELAFLKLRHAVARVGSEVLGLSILPTLRCNLRCVYCYEDHLDLDMDEETQSKLLAYVEKRLQANRGLSVSWFGGEPLLRVDMIRDLSKKLLGLCADNKASYEAQITTNGLLLTHSIAKELRDLGVRFAQITLDGPQPIHDARRTLPSGAGSYARILSNVLEIADLLSLRIRVNLDQETAHRTVELLDDLEPVRDKVSIGFYPVAPTRTACESGLECFSISEFAPFHQGILREAYDRGFQLVSGYALAATVYCGAYQLNTHAVDPRGDVFSCVEDVGHRDRRIGYLADTGSIEFLYPRLLPRATWSPFEDEACVACRVLPICMGGCLRRIEAGSKDRCFLKQGLEERLRFVIKASKQKDRREVKT